MGPKWGTAALADHCPDHCLTCQGRVFSDGAGKEIRQFSETREDRSSQDSGRGDNWNVATDESPSLKVKITQGNAVQMRKAVFRRFYALVSGAAQIYKAEQNRESEKTENNRYARPDHFCLHLHCNSGSSVTVILLVIPLPNAFPVSISN